MCPVCKRRERYKEEVKHEAQEVLHAESRQQESSLQDA